MSERSSGRIDDEIAFFTTFALITVPIQIIDKNFIWATTTEICHYEVYGQIPENLLMKSPELFLLSYFPPLE